MIKFLSVLAKAGQVYVGWFILCTIGLAILFYRDCKKYDDEFNEEEKENEDDE